MTTCPATGDELEKPSWAKIGAMTEDTVRLDWLERNNASIEPRFGDPPWIGVFWNGTDAGGNTLREAIDAAIVRGLSRREVSTTAQPSSKNES